MTPGRTAKRSNDPRRKKSNRLLTEFGENHENSLESRVAVLEARIDEMQEEINRISGNAVPAQIQEALDNIGEPRTEGRKKITDSELSLNRDNLVQWMEEHWPKIVKPLLAARNPREIAAALQPVASPPDIRPTWQIGILDHPGELLDFLRSEKFRRKPPRKTVADALALYKSEQR
jgi:hypothetical protein